MAKIVNIETLFYMENLKKKFTWVCPQGMSDVGKDENIILNKCIYGLVQAVRQYYKKAVKILDNFGSVGGNVNPCLYIKKSAKDIVYVALHNLMVGDVEAIDDATSVKPWKGCSSICPAK